MSTVPRQDLVFDLKSAMGFGDFVSLALYGTSFNNAAFFVSNLLGDCYVVLLDNYDSVLSQTSNIVFARPPGPAYGDVMLERELPSRAKVSLLFGHWKSVSLQSEHIKQVSSFPVLEESEIMLSVGDSCHLCS